MKSLPFILIAMVMTQVLPACVREPAAETPSIEALNQSWRTCLQREADIAGTAPYPTERVVEIAFDRCAAIEAQLIQAHEQRAQGMVTAEYLQEELRTRARPTVTAAVEVSRARRAEQ